MFYENFLMLLPLLGIGITAVAMVSAIYLIADCTAARIQGKACSCCE